MINLDAFTPIAYGVGGTVLVFFILYLLFYMFSKRKNRYQEAPYREQPYQQEAPYRQRSYREQPYQQEAPPMAQTQQHQSREFFERFPSLSGKMATLEGRPIIWTMQDTKRRIHLFREQEIEDNTVDRTRVEEALKLINYKELRCAKCNENSCSSREEHAQATINEVLATLKNQEDDNYGTGNKGQGPVSGYF